MKKSPKDAGLAKALLLMCWYLGYSEDGDYSLSTRSDVLEEVRLYLSEATASQKQELRRGKGLLLREFEAKNHPLRGDVEAYLGKLLRELGIDT